MEIIISHFQRHHVWRGSLPEISQQQHTARLGQDMAPRIYPSVLSWEQYFLIAKLAVLEENFSFVGVLRVSAGQKLWYVIGMINKKT